MLEICTQPAEHQGARAIAFKPHCRAVDDDRVSGDRRRAAVAQAIRENVEYNGSAPLSGELQTGDQKIQFDDVCVRRETDSHAGSHRRHQIEGWLGGLRLRPIRETAKPDKIRRSADV